jgi:hypothetical protein
MKTPVYLIPVICEGYFEGSISISVAGIRIFSLTPGKASRLKRRQIILNIIILKSIGKGTSFIDG